MQLNWNHVHSRFDFAYDALRKQLGNSAELQEFANGLLAALPSRQQQAIALEKRLAELSGSAAPETWQQYASLPELLSSNPVYEQHAALIESS